MTARAASVVPPAAESFKNFLSRPSASPELMQPVFTAVRAVNWNDAASRAAAQPLVDAIQSATRAYFAAASVSTAGSRSVKLAAFNEPALWACLSKDQQASVKSAYAELTEEERGRATTLIGSASADWSFPEDSAQHGVLTHAQLPHVLEAAAARSGPVTLRARSFSLLPASARSALARRGETFRALQVRQLRKEISELMPPEAFQFMAYLPQTSYDYLVQSFPEVPEAIAKFDRTRAAHPEWTDWELDWNSRSAKEAAWFLRIAKVHERLQELTALETLQSVPDAESELGLTHLSLALLEGFAYGFQWKVARNDARWIDESTVHYQEALKRVERSAGPRSMAALTVKYLQGKHALHGAYSYSNAGYYTRSGKKIPPESQAHTYLAQAQSLLSEVRDEAKRRMSQGHGASGVADMYFESRYFLLQAASFERNFAGIGGGPYDQEWQARDLEKVLIDALLAAPPHWVMEQFRPYGFMRRLINTVRWARSGMAGHETLIELEKMRSTDISYEELIRRLVEKVGLEQLRPLLPHKLPGAPSDSLAAPR